MKKRQTAVFLTVASMLFALIPNVYATDIDSRYTALNKKYTQIKLLLTDCEKKGIATDYERVGYRVLERFIEYGKEDISNSKTERAEYMADCLEKISEEIITNLQDYRKGTKEPVSVDRYITSETKIEGYSTVSKVKNNITGEISEKSVIFTGYGHFDTVAEDIEIMKDLGVNIIQQELVMYDCIVNPSSYPAEGWKHHEENMQTDITYEKNSGINSGAALHFVNTSQKEDGKFTELRQTMYCEPSKTYTISVTSKGNTASVYLMPDGWGSGSYKISPTDDYVTTKISYTTGKTQRKMTPYLVITGTADFYIDEISVVSGGVEYAHNPDMEKETKVYESNGVKFGIDPTSAKNVSKNLERCENSDVRMDILLAPHYFPQFLINSGTDMKHTTSGVENFGVNIYNDLSKDAMKVYINEILPYFKGYNSLNSICISNEPGYTTKNSESYHKNDWVSFLTEKYNDVTTLNSAYGRNGIFGGYTKLQSVSMTKKSSDLAAEYADWREFNNRMFADWHGEMTDEIKKILPETPVHVKVMNYIRYTDKNNGDGNYNRYFMDLGTDCEEFDEFSDYHGNDVHSYYNVQWGPFLGELLWYDYLNTISEKPIYNSEDHIIEDRNKDYSENQAKHYRANLWQGAIHGRTLQTTWVYERTYDEEDLLSDSILDRPDVMEISGRTSLDLNRLSEEVTVFQNMTPEIAVWYSDNTRNYNRNHIDYLMSAYTDAISAGKRVSVLTDKQIENGSLDTSYKILIIPGVTAASAKALEKVAGYVKNGGTVITTGSCFSTDQWKKSVSSEDKSYIINNSIKCQSGVFDEIISALNKKDPKRIRVIDTTTGNDIKNVDFRVTESGGKYLINICRLDDINSQDAKTVKILKDGKTMKVKEDILNNETDLQLYSFRPELWVLEDDPYTRDYQIKIISKSSENIEKGNYSFNVIAKNTTEFWNMLKMEAVLYNQNGKRLKAVTYKKGMSSGDFMEMTGEFKIPEDNCYIEISVSDRNDIVSENTLILN